ncbi:MAG: ThuA domain-containing protein [Candidatus Solibacter sp.]
MPKQSSKMHSRYLENIAFALLASLAILAGTTRAATREIVLIAGPPSHTHLAHEHRADATLLARFLNQAPGIHATVSKTGWPADENLIAKADGIAFFCDGGESHLIAQDGHAAQIQAAADCGAGLFFYHYAVEPPGKSLHKEFLDWIGGYFELNHSVVNSYFDLDFASLPEHPITRGVAPFKINDEWYYNIRFRDDTKGTTQILVGTPPASSMSQADGPHEGNANVRSKVGQPQCMMWAYERPGGGRAVGYTGGHFHINLGDDNVRKLVLNALVWVARGEVPPFGVPSHVTQADLMQNLDPKTFVISEIRRALELPFLLALNIYLWTTWRRDLFNVSRLRASIRLQFTLVANAFLCLALTFACLITLTRPEVRGSRYYLLLYELLAGLWLAGALRLFPVLGVRLRDDAPERANAGALWTMNGGLAGVAMCFVGATVGNGPGPKAVIFCATLASATFFLLWRLIGVAGVRWARAVTVDGDCGSGLRLGALLFSIGLALGSAVTGDGVSPTIPVRDFFIRSWPVLPVLCVAVMARRGHPVPAR